MRLFPKKIEGMIFDLDGVLIDSEKYQSQGWIRALKDYKIFISEKETLAFKGKSAEKIEKELKERFNLKIKKRELLKKRDEVILKIWQRVKKIKLMPYSKYILEFSKKNFSKIGLASTGFKREVLLKLRKAKILNYFSVIVTRDDVKKGKPSPDIYLKAIKKLKILPNECLAIEDTQAGVESAKNAGLICFAIPSQFSKNQNFSKADRIFKNLKEVVGFLKTIGFN